MRRTSHLTGAMLTGVAMLMVAAGCTNDVGVRATEHASVDSVPPTGGSAPDNSAPSGSTPDTTPNAESIDWTTCTDDAADDPALECATLTVPLDYEDPQGDTIDLALVRKPASGDREGAVLFNPGGPGGSGFDPIAYSGSVLQSELGLDNFDLVGFDPRGVDRSGGIHCVDDKFLDEHLYLDDTPDTPEEQALLDESETGFTKGCQQRYGDTLRNYSTANTARDMDMIRAGLGDDQISYLGISYGTYLGAVYASMFPERVRAMVLDSAFEPNGDTVEEQYLTQLVGFEEAFNNWSAWCESEPSCAFTSADVGARWDALRAQLDEHPVSGADGRLANQTVLDTATSAALYSESDWPVLADALAKAENGDSEALFALADAYNARNADGTFDTLFQSFDVIQCASGINSQPPPDPEALLAEMHQKAPRFSQDTTLKDLQDAGKECNDLMSPQPVAEISYDGEAPIVVVGGTNDPATPIRWAEEMVGELGPSARLLTYTGEGHGQLLTSKCVTEIEGAVLANLKLPKQDAQCDPDPVVERPAFFDDLPVPDGIGPVAELPAVNAALGLTDTLGYGESRLTDLSSQEAYDAYKTALEDAGWTAAGTQDTGIPDTVSAAFYNDNGDFLLAFVLGPDSFDSVELQSAKASVPEGQTVVLLAYLPN